MGEVEKVCDASLRFSNVVLRDEILQVHSRKAVYPTTCRLVDDGRIMDSPRKPQAADLRLVIFLIQIRKL